MKLRPWPYAMALLLPVGCQDFAGQTLTVSEATDVTNEYMAENLPRELSRVVIETVDLNDRWRVTYRRHKGGTGGPIVFDVRKRDGEIINIHSEQ